MCWREIYSLKAEIQFSPPSKSLRKLRLDSLLACRLGISSTDFLIIKFVSNSLPSVFISFTLCDLIQLKSSKENFRSKLMHRYVLLGFCFNLHRIINVSSQLLLSSINHFCLFWISWAWWKFQPYFYLVYGSENVEPWIIPSFPIKLCRRSGKTDLNDLHNRSIIYMSS